MSAVQSKRPEAPAVHTTDEAGSNDTVTVACKLPNGIVLHIDEMVDSREPVMGGGFAVVKRAQQMGPTYTLNGNRVPFGQAPRHSIVAGYALTPGIPRQFFERWLEQNKHSDYVVNNLIFAHVKVNDVRDESKEKAGVRSNLEPLKLDSKGLLNDPRVEKSKLKNLKTIETAELESA